MRRPAGSRARVTYPSGSSPPDLLEWSRRWCCERDLRSKEFQVSVTPCGTLQPASDCVYDPACRQRVRERWTDRIGYPLASSKTPWIADSQKPLHPRVPRSATGAVRAARHHQITTAPSQAVLNELLAFCRWPGLLPRNWAGFPIRSDPTGGGSAVSLPLVVGRTGYHASQLGRCRLRSRCSPRPPRPRLEGDSLQNSPSHPLRDSDRIQSSGMRRAWNPHPPSRA